MIDVNAVAKWFNNTGIGSWLGNSLTDTYTLSGKESTIRTDAGKLVIARKFVYLKNSKEISKKEFDDAQKFGFNSSHSSKGSTPYYSPQFKEADLACKLFCPRPADKIDSGLDVDREKLSYLGEKIEAGSYYNLNPRKKIIRSHEEEHFQKYVFPLDRMPPTSPEMQSEKLKILSAAALGVSIVAGSAFLLYNLASFAYSAFSE